MEHNKYVQSFSQANEVSATVSMILCYILLGYFVEAMTLSKRKAVVAVGYNHAVCSAFAVLHPLSSTNSSDIAQVTIVTRISPGEEEAKVGPNFKSPS